MGIDRDSYREASRQIWGSVAPGWEERRERLMRATAPVNQWLLEKADLGAGQTVLDIGAGTGDLGFAASHQVKPGGRLISTDFAPEMVEVARRVGEAEGIDNVEHLVMDAEKMPLEDSSVDAILCRWAFMLMADPAAAFAESRRVLREGGRLAFAVWTTPDRNPSLLPVAAALIERGHLSPPDPEGPGIFAFGKPERFLSLLAEAGFAQPDYEEVTFSYTHPNFDDAWDMVRKLAGPLEQAMKGLPADEVDEIRQIAEDASSPFRSEDGSYSIPASTWVVLARP